MPVDRRASFPGGEAAHSSTLPASVDPVPSHRPGERALRNGTATPSSGRLSALVSTFGLDEPEIALLIVALAPDVDIRFRDLYARLDGPHTPGGRVTTGTALRLCGISAVHGIARTVLCPSGRLRSGGLVETDAGTGNYLGRPLWVPDRVTSHLLGHDTLSERLREVAELVHLTADPALPEGGVLDETVRTVASLLTDGHPVYVRDTDASDLAEPAARAALARVGKSDEVLHLRLDRMPSGPDGDALLTAVVVECRLRGCGLLVGPVPEPPPDTSRLIDAPVPVVVFGRLPWPHHDRARPLVVDCPRLDVPTRMHLWRAALSENRDFVARPELMDALAREMAPRRLSPRQIRAAVHDCARHARARRVRPGADELRAAATHARGRDSLGGLTRLVRPDRRWTDLVLPCEPLEQLRDLIRRARHRDLVLNEWAMRPGGGRGHGVTALFSGPSGTGKTLAAEVLAHDLGVDLHVIDLSTVVDKYIGETEKRLERLFTAAADVDALLLFDEADALFGKRTAVKDAHDRYANIETAYLLQRLEAFDGVAVLTTNFHGNVDPAFTRRLDHVVHFPAPDAEQRRTLWDVALGTVLPRAEDIDLDRLADVFDLTGGDIHCCAVSAAYRAAVERRPVTMGDLIAATRAEMRKLGRLVDEAVFTDPTGR
ncbi:ATP-binding protein [Embleya hyalina]